MFIRRSLRIRTLVIPTGSPAIRSRDNSPGHIQQERTISDREMLYSPQHQCGAGQWVKRRNDVPCIDMPKRRDLIVGKHAIVGVLVGGIDIAARRCRNEVANFSYRGAHRCSIRPPGEPVAKHTTITRGQIARAYNCSVCEGVLSGDDQRYPVQMIALLDESRLDLVARSKAVLGPFLLVSFCRMKPFHVDLLHRKMPRLLSADGANFPAIVDCSDNPVRAKPRLTWFPRVRMEGHTLALPGSIAKS